MTDLQILKKVASFLRKDTEGGGLLFLVNLPFAGFKLRSGLNGKQAVHPKESGGQPRAQPTFP